MTIPRLLADRYELGDIVGFGGMAEVYRARDTRLRRDVAVKILRSDLARDPTFHTRFHREARNAAALSHPAIVAVHDTGETDSSDGALPYIVMELVEGTNLRDVVRTDGPMPTRRAVEIVADVCQALSVSHEHGIVHRDIKPANIMVTTAGAVKVMDFGIARAITDTGDLTRTAAVLGTAHYLSPEQAHGEDVDSRSDIYSLGCVLYELLTGEPPFTGDTPVSVAYQHVRKDPTPPSQRVQGVSDDLDAVVLHALAKNRDNRYPSADAFRADLMRVYIGQAPDAPEVDRSSLAVPGDRPPAEPAPRRRRLLTIAALVAVVVVAVGLTVRFTVFGADIRVPQLRNQTEQQAVSALQSLGLRTTSRDVTDPDVDIGLVVGTDPPADSLASRDDEVTIQVSNGPPQQRVPDVAGRSPDDAEQTLKSAGFQQIRQSQGVSDVADVGKVIKTEPAASTIAAVTNIVTIVVGGGPGETQVPVVAKQTADSAERVLRAAGFTKLIRVPVDSAAPVDEVVGTDPAAGQQIPADQLIQIQLSLANQFVMPQLVGRFWNDGTDSSAKSILDALGNTGPMIPGPMIPNGGQPSKAVVNQLPAVGTPVLKTASVILSFAP